MNASAKWPVLLALAHLSVLRAQTQLPAITTAMAVRDLPALEAAKEYPVKVRAVITYVNAQAGELFIQDASAGVFVFIRYSKSNLPLEAGQVVDINGVTAPGDFSASITKADIKVGGRSGMPKPVRLPFEHLLTGEEDCQWGELKGVVRSGRVNEGVLSLNVVTTGGAFLVIMKDYPANWSASLIDAKVTLEGVLAAVFNEHRQVAGVRMFIPAPRFIHIDDPAPVSPFDLPQTSALSVGAFRTNRDWSRRIRVRATVTATVSKSLVYVSEGDGNLPAEMDLPCSAQPEDILDIVGFPGSIDARPGLKNAVCRVVAEDRRLAPLPVAARDILPPEAPEIGSGLSIAAGTRYDLKLVTLEGTLIQVTRGVRSQTLTLASMDQNFTVTIPDSIPAPEKTFELGSKLKLTGVCLIVYDEYRRAQSFRILVRHATDITVQSRPPWWTLRHALWIMGGMLVIVFAALAWISVLRKHVAAKTNELSEANERLRRISVEDALTGAANRRLFDEMLATEVNRGRRASTPVSLIIADIDQFKAVNDLYGHQTGDDYLIQVVQALRSAISRAGDVVARYGGEEFAVILPDTGDQAAAAIAESMRRAVEDLAMAHTASPFNQHLSVSLGVGTLWPGSTYSAQDLIGLADRALYHAKQSGRNRVVSSGAVTMAI